MLEEGAVMTMKSCAAFLRLQGICERDLQGVAAEEV
jgi:hypothetical protein